MRTQNPETMTPAERDAEVASIFALGLARAIHAKRPPPLRIPPGSQATWRNLTPIDLNFRSMQTSVSPHGPGVRAPDRCEEEFLCLMRSNDNSASFSG